MQVGLDVWANALELKVWWESGMQMIVIPVEIRDARDAAIRILYDRMDRM